MEILIVSPIDQSAIDTLRTRHRVICHLDPDQEQLRSLASSCEVLVFRSGVTIDRSVLEVAPRLRLLVRAGAGRDNVDLEAAQARGIKLETIPEPGAQAVAEMAFALMLALGRNLLTADRLTRAGKWAKHQLTGDGLGGKTLGVVGAGNIGSRVGSLGSAWGMDVLGCVERPSRRVAAELAGFGIALVHLREVLSRSDFVSVHVPLHASSRNLIDAEALACMKPGSYLVNLSRGGVVDEDALAWALLNGHLGGAALDVHLHEGDGMTSPLAGIPNTVLTPHIGAGTRDARRRIALRVVTAIQRLEPNETVSAGEMARATT